jgi:hypothetical protein
MLKAYFHREIHKFWAKKKLILQTTQNAQSARWPCEQCL